MIAATCYTAGHARWWALPGVLPSGSAATGQADLLLLGLALFGAYLAWCFWYPYGQCPWPGCGGKQNVGDGRGHYRRRGPTRGVHRWLHPDRSVYRRLGARMIRRG